MHPVESDFHLPGSGHCALSVHLHGGLGDTPRTSGSGWGHPLKVPKEDAPALLWSPFFLMAALGANGSSRSCVRSFNPQYWAGNRTHTSIETQAAAVRLPTHCATVGTVGTYLLFRPVCMSWSTLCPGQHSERSLNGCPKTFLYLCGCFLHQ